ncbi:MAG TPA: hypothetical protein DCR93_00280 [Cytophagales bacterium]|nr:hypothetical protein [Cytophagales bacterium]HAP58002.1 hypothetical protein [Cytophagales bacterium]
MELHITQVPGWVSISFALLFISIPPLLIANAAKAALGLHSPEEGKLRHRQILIFYVGYLLVVGAIALTGFFAVEGLPPRILVTTTLPLVLFYFLVIRRKDWFKTTLHHISLEQLVFIHLFRLVGAYFLLVEAYGALPRGFAYVGGTGDILTAVFAIPVILLLRREAKIVRPLTWAWNIFGLLDITSVLVSAMVSTRLAMDGQALGVAQFGTFPFAWIPAFAPATIIFLHVITFQKLQMTKAAKMAV